MTTTTTVVYEWTARVVLDRNALGGGYSVVVFLLSPEEANQDNASSLVPSKPSEWPRPPYYVGRVAAVPTTLEARSGDEEPQLTQGFVHLDRALNAKLGKTDIESVVPYLKTALHWKVSQPEPMEGPPLDEELDINKLPSLEVAVMSSKLKEQTGLFPEYEPPVVHPEITSGKKGGVKV